MRIEVRQENRKRIGRVEVDPTLHPTRALTVDGEHEVFLEWEAAIDDSGKLRRCVACGCRDLYVVRTFPQLTGFVVVLAFAGAAVGILGLAENPLVLAALFVVLILDIASLVFSKRKLVCYKCGSTYSLVEIARQLRPWDREIANKFQLKAKDSASPALESVRFIDV